MNMSIYRCKDGILIGMPRDIWKAVRFIKRRSYMPDGVVMDMRLENKEEYEKLKNVIEAEDLTMIDNLIMNEPEINKYPCNVSVVVEKGCVMNIEKWVWSDA